MGIIDRAVFRVLSCSSFLPASFKKYESLSDGGLGSVEFSSYLSVAHPLDKRRLIKRLGTLKPETVQKVDQAIQIDLEPIELSAVTIH